MSPRCWLPRRSWRLEHNQCHGPSYFPLLRSILHNPFNFANVDLPGSALNGLLTGGAGQINATTRADHNVNRVGVGTGVYGLGSPRQIEFGLRLTF